MTEISERFRRINAGFLTRAEAVADDQWANPAPCEGWVARDVVRHLVEWMPGLVLGSVGLPLPQGPSVDEDPVGAWRAVADAFQPALDDPAVAALEFDSQAGHLSVEQAIDMLCTPDVLIHTWDLARATGLDEKLDPDEVHRQYAGMLPWDEALRSSGHYGPKVPVPDSADEQTKLIAFTGRTP